MIGQRQRALLGRGADAEEQRGIIGHVARHQFGDALLGGDVQHLAGGIGEVLALGRQFDTAMFPAQQPAVAQADHVAPGGIGLHAAQGGQRLNGLVTVPLDRLENKAGTVFGR
jgi:hypothetical protein